MWNVKITSNFASAVSFWLKWNVRVKTISKRCPPPKLTSTEWLSARAYGHFSSSTTNNCTKNTACPSAYTEQQDRWNIYLLSICTGILEIFDILQFEISSLIFILSLNWEQIPVWNIKLAKSKIPVLCHFKVKQRWNFPGFHFFDSQQWV